MNKELWKELIYNDEYFGNKYLISNMGRLKNKNTNHIYKLQIQRDGYVIKSIYICTKNHKKIYKLIYLHIAVGCSFIPNPKKLPQINHKDGNKANNFVDNLEWVTPRENVKHSIEHKLQPTGKLCPWSKLSLNDVNYIRQVYKKGDKLYGATALSVKYNVDRSTISLIVNNKRWKND